MGVVTFKRDGSELGIGDLDAARELLVDQQCAHLQPGGSGGGADVVENRLVAAERMAGQFLLISLNRRWSIGFHLEAPLG